MNKYLVFIIIPLFLLTGCGNGGENSSLSEAERLAAINPDSAHIVLNGIDTSHLTNENERMLYRLLALEVADKLYEPHKDDKEIKGILDYFIGKNKLKRVHPLVFYYAGRVYSDLGEDAKALSYFKKALKVMPPASDYDLEDRINSQLGYLYMNHRLFNHALRHLHRSTEITKERGDTANFIEINLNIADVYLYRHQTDSAENIYRNLEKMAEQCRDSVTRSIYCTQLAHFYNAYYSPEKADSILRDFPLVYDQLSRTSILLIKERIDREFHRTGMNEDFYLTMLESPEPGVRFQGAMLLAESREGKGDGRGMMTYLRKGMKYLREQQNKYNTTSLVEMEKIIDEADLENENLKLSLSNQRKQKQLLVLLGVMGVVIGIAVALIARGRMGRMRLELEMERMKGDNLNMVRTLEREIEQLKNGPDGSRPEDIVARTRRLESSLALARRKEEMVKMLQSGGNADAEEEFVRLREALAVTNPEFIARLDSMKLRSREYQDSLLVKIDIPQKVCAAFFGVTPAAVANWRKRLLSKWGEGGNFKNWKEYIESLH